MIKNPFASLTATTAHQQNLANQQNQQSQMLGQQLGAYGMASLPPQPTLTGPNKHNVKALVPYALNAIMTRDREAAYIYTPAELAEKVWDMAEALEAEGRKRGMP